MLIKSLPAKAPPYLLRRRLGTFERGVWWSGVESGARDPGLVRAVVCAVLSMPRDELAHLDGAASISREGSHAAPLIGAEVVREGHVLIAYESLPDEPHRSGRALALTPGETLVVAEQLLVVLERMHRAGLVHAGLSAAAIAIARGPDGVRAQLRGIGLPSLPGRTSEDDVIELATLLRFVMLDDGSDPARKAAIEAALDRALGLSGLEHANTRDALAELRALMPRARNPHGRRAHLTSPNMVAALRQARVRSLGAASGLSG